MCWKNIFRNCRQEDVHKKLIGDDEKPKCCSCIPSWYKEEVKIFFNLAWPLILTFMCQFLLPAVGLVFCGRLGTMELAGAALANTIINVTGSSVGLGLSYACDTLFSQTYGSENKKKLGVYLQRSLIILSLSVFLCWTLHLNTFTILIKMKQHPEIARIAAEYVITYMPGLLGMYIYNVINKYLQNQDIVIPVLITGIIGNICNAALHAIFINVLQLGTNGSAGAQAISFWLMLLCSLVYLYFSKVYEETWEGWTWEAFEDWGTFLKLAIPGMLIIVLEFLSFEVATILSGVLGSIQLDSQSIMFQLNAMMSMIPQGIAMAANIRVGQCLGANNIDGAKRVCKTTYSLTAIFCILGAITVLAIKSLVAKVFTDDPKVISYVSGALPFLAFFLILDAMNVTSSGILRGCGRQFICSIIVFICFYVFGLPCGIPLMFFTKLEVSGFWVGLIIALFIEDVIYIFIILRTNWEKEANLALERAGVTESAATCTEEEEKILLTKSTKCKKLSSLILSRTIAILLIFLIFGVGIFFHFYIPRQIGKCAPYSNVLLFHGTIPNHPNACNQTL